MLHLSSLMLMRVEPRGIKVSVAVRLSCVSETCRASWVGGDVNSRKVSVVTLTDGAYSKLMRLFSHVV